MIGRGYGANLLLGLFEMAEITKAARTQVVAAVIDACGGQSELRDAAIQAAGDAEEEFIRKKIAFIKVPFAYSEQGICAVLD